MNYSELDLNLLKTFLCVFETKSILSASKKLYISQPAVTNSIKKLEKHLGGELFVRTSKGVIPTEEGKQFSENCYNALKLIENGINNFNAYSTLTTGRLNIGSSSTIIRKLLLPFIEVFSKRYPNIIISITDATSDRLVKMTKRGEVDFSVINTPIDYPETFDITKITETTDGFIASKDFEKDFISKNDIKKYPLILQKYPSNNREYFEQICLSNNINLVPNYELASFGLITDFVEKGIGIAFTVLDFVKEDIENGRIKKLETDLAYKSRDVVTITPSLSVNSFACKTFIKELKEYFDKK